MHHQALHPQNGVADELRILRLEQRQVQADLQAVDTDLVEHFECFFIVVGDLRVGLEGKDYAGVLGHQGDLAKGMLYGVPLLQPVLVLRDAT